MITLKQKTILISCLTLAAIVIMALSLYAIVKFTSTDEDTDKSITDNSVTSQTNESEISSTEHSYDTDDSEYENEHTSNDPSNESIDESADESTDESANEQENNNSSEPVDDASQDVSSLPDIENSDADFSGDDPNEESVNDNPGETSKNTSDESNNVSVGDSTTSKDTTHIESETSNLIPGLKPAQITLLKPVASGILVKKNDSATIDYSNTNDGYVMVKFTAATTLKLKVQVKGPTTTYTYNLNPGEWTVFPLSDGNGEYAIKVYKNVVDNKYATVLSLKCNITLDDEFAPFIRPNQYVNYENATNTMNTAASLLNDEMAMLEKVAVIYDFVIKNISYDYNKAATVQSGYLPVLDVVLKEKKGICFDYAALMTGMLRSQNIPCKLVVGYAGTEYHAWISVWSPETGWIDGAIFFNGTNWQRMDPTFAAGGYKDFDKIDYITKYIY